MFQTENKSSITRTIGAASFCRARLIILILGLSGCGLIGAPAPIKLQTSSNHETAKSISLQGRATELGCSEDEVFDTTEKICILSSYCEAPRQLSGKLCVAKDSTDKPVSTNSEAGDPSAAR